ncbi:hypothetical protein [Amycolatopsis pigmentata]|uniref:LppX_LprAFG lipoprotein n=1 Tax=Amycolatopsis pigmentata TaxID=450801 RepID=A0ABW5FW77_9PSEU
MRKTALVAAGMALLITVGGCGAKTGNALGPTPAGQDGSTSLFGDVQQLVRAASAKAGQVKTAKFTYTQTLGSQQTTGEGEGRFDGPNTAMRMTLNVEGEKVEARIVGKQMYFQLPASARAASSGKPWTKISLDAGAGKGFGQMMDQAEQNDPAHFLDQIQQAGTITKSEQTVLDGQRVSHYWVDLDVAKALDKVVGDAMPKDQIQKIAGQVKTIPLQMWLNADQLPVQVTEDLGAVMKASGTPGADQGMGFTMKYTDWGAPVDVQAPPADQVGEMKLPG